MTKTGIIHTSFDLLDPHGMRKTMTLSISAPVEETPGNWSMKVECPAIPHASATFTGANALTCACFTLNLVRRFMREELEKGYTAEGWGDIHDFLDELFAVQPDDWAPTPPP